MYQFLDNSREVLYVGKAKDLKSRVSSYFTNSSGLSGKTRALVGQVTLIKAIIVESEIESLLLEANLIKKYQPYYNIKLTDGKAYPLIRITIKDDYPKVLIARREEDKSSVYFGPYPSTQSMYSVLRFLRKLFPFQSVLNHPKRICLYHHLGLCPCPQVFDSQELKKQYKKNITHIKDFLSGKTQKVVKDLEKERENMSGDEKFEEARALQKNIDAILLVTHPIHRPFEYETNPNLHSDLRQKEMEDLQLILWKNGVKISLPKRIECYDNSNFQGTNPTSSMVVLTNGEIDKSQYRKFKIRSQNRPNDFATMEEVLQRRLRHKEWPLPDLVIVDGGKGQVSSALKVLESFRPEDDGPLAQNIPVIGLAKREETIVTSDLKEISLSKDSPALQLIMRIRDEAHRFAISYHRKLRAKEFLK